ncbi:PGF-pre-PGF domain-containing protein [Methanofollis ethanolicus]|uniref:PGF-pre-PGF domain-containing protein n=1 Tax=Methanofollis ethanolicus TaxID=488124 RepID=UPI000833C85F|nr:PGF-pre-PGF domain-containing protein [Methanofollis ethanolicus]
MNFSSQVVFSNDQSGVFYINDTGGRGWDDNGILMLAVNGTIPDDFRVNIKASGYQWTPVQKGNFPAFENITYVPEALDETFTKDDFLYGPQIWRPCPAVNYPIFDRQDMTDTGNTFSIMFIDLNAGILGKNTLSQPDFSGQAINDKGAIKVEYSFENLETFAAFNAYVYTVSSNQGQGVRWTNPLSAGGASGYAVTGIKPILTSINVTPAVADLKVNEKQQFTAAALDQNDRPMTGLTFEWSSSNETVGTVNETGYFTAHAAGTTTVTATNETVEGTADVTVTTAPTGADLLYDGDVFLPKGEATVTSSQGSSYQIPYRTPLGALDTVAKAESFTYKVTDRKWIDSGILMLDDIDSYPFIKSQKSWTCYVNDVALDDYGKPSTDGLNKRVLVDGDRVNFYYGPKGATTPENAEAAVLITARLTNADIVYNGEVTLGAGNVTVTASQGTTHSIPALTPLGALDAAAQEKGFLYNFTNKKWQYGQLLLDDIGTYRYNKVNDTYKEAWACSVNGEARSAAYNSADQPLQNGDVVLFLYGPDGSTTRENALAIIQATVKVASAPGDWALTLKGKTTVSFTKAQFEDAVDCGHVATYTDGDGEWKGVPLWYLVGAVDDEDTGSHYTFNNELAAEGYSVKVTDRNLTHPYDINFPSAAIARNNNYIVANTLNGQPLPELTSGGKPCWPLQMVGSDVTMGKKIGNIGAIELVGLPEPSEGWTLTLKGDIEDTFTQAYFEESVRCHGVTYTDEAGEWKGMPLWYLTGWVDDHTIHGSGAFNTQLAADGYTVRVSASDGFNATFASANVAKSSDYIVANTLNGQPLAEGDFPLKLVGKNVTSGKQKVGTISEISLVGLPGGPKPGEWTLTLKGEITDTITQSEFEAAAACSHHTVTWTDDKNREWSGIPLWSLCGWVDDYTIHGSGAFNSKLAAQGYTVIVTGSGDYSKEFSSKIVSQNNDFIIANKLNGTLLTNENGYPVRLVGSALTEGSQSVASIESIELTAFQKPTEIPSVRIVKYAADRTTVLSEKTIDYRYMEEKFPVYGDGETHYYFEGLNFPPADPWDQAETYPGGLKIDEQIKGTSVRDLCNLAGGMGPDTEITFAAPDGWETSLHYGNIYAPEEQQGEAVLVWYTGRQGYVPDYADGYRLFFAPDDHVFGQWNMHECIDEKYWHYNSGLPSCAGLSAKYISEIRIYDVAEPTWNLQLDGAIDKTISKGYFESGLACTMGANHEKSYTDSKGREWSGMPLWFLLGYVDDENFHTGKSFNDTLAAEGYAIHIVGKDGSETIIDSRDAMYSDKYILANSLNGMHIAGDDENWPLRLVGENVSGMDTIKGVVKVSFIPPNLQGNIVSLGNISAGGEKALDLEKGAVSKITIKAAGDVRDGELAIDVPDELPNYIDTPAENIFQYLHIVYPAPENTIDEAVIAFDLPLTWLNSHRMAVTDVRLLRYTNGAWQGLPTTFIKEENGRAYFSATTPGFCYFAVGGVAAPAPTPSPSYSHSSSSGSTSAVSAVSGSIPAGESKSFSVTETAFSTITVSAYDRIEHFLFTVKKASLPKGAPAPEGAVYEIQEVTLYKTDPLAIEGVTIEFAVEAAWLKAQGVSAGDVALLRHVNGEWIRLQTTFIEEKEGKAYYSAESPGFSFFAITAEKGSAVAPDDVQAPVGEVTAPTPAINETTAATPTPTTPQQSPVFWALPFIAFGALLLLRRR